MPRRPPPPKKRGQKTGPRSFIGRVMDVATLATDLGDTPKGIRAKVARGVLPHRRLGGRIVFLAEDVEQFLRALPGVTAEEALRNMARRTGGAA